MTCCVCKDPVEIVKSDNGIEFLSCGHTACLNPHKWLHANWNGFLDNEPVSFDLFGMDLVPNGDMNSFEKWFPKEDKCPSCGGAISPSGRQSSQPDGLHIELTCGHEVVR